MTLDQWFDIWWNVRNNSTREFAEAHSDLWLLGQINWTILRRYL